MRSAYAAFSPRSSRITQVVSATGYDPECRPLWLLFSLSSDRIILPDMVRPLVVHALAGADITPFVRVVVRMSGMVPVVVP